MRLLQAGPTWTCTGCTVVASFAPGCPAPPLPKGWARTGDGYHCLRCRRAAVAAAALRDAGLTVADIGAAAASARGLAAFELERNPDRSAGEIARTIGTSASIVGQVRRQLTQAAELAAADPGGAP